MGRQGRRSDGALKTEEKTHTVSLVGVVDLSHSVDTIKELKWGKEGKFINVGHVVGWVQLADNSTTKNFNKKKH